MATTITMWAILDSTLVNDHGEVPEWDFLETYSEGIHNLYYSAEAAEVELKRVGVTDCFIVPITFDFGCTRKVTLDIKRMPLIVGR